MLGYYDFLKQFPLFKSIVIWTFTKILKTINKTPRKYNHERANVVIISLHKLGDTVFTFPAVGEIIRRNEGKKIIIICYENSRALYEKYFRVATEILTHDNFILNDRIAGYHARKKIKQLEPAILFDITGVMTSATLIINSGASWIIGTNRDLFQGLYTEFYPTNEIQHSTDIYLKAIGLKFTDCNCKYEVDAKYDRTKIILIHPFAGWKSKEWDINKFIELSLELNKVYKSAFIILAGSIEHEKIIDMNRKGISVISCYSTEELMNELDKCSILISNDTGPIQIAAILGKPTFSIYGPTNPSFHLPRGKNHKFINYNIKCSPRGNEKICFTNGGKKGCPSFECLNLLSVDDVYKSFRMYLTGLENEPY